MTTAREIRRMALGSAGFIAGAGVAYQLVLGEDLARAIFLGLTALVVSLVAWGVYHRTSRRNNGLVVAWTAAAHIALRPAPPARDWLWPLVLLALYVLFAWIMGLAARVATAGADPPPAEVDRAS